MRNRDKLRRSTVAACAVIGLLLSYPGVAEAGTARLVQRPDLGISIIHFEGQIAKGDLARIQQLLPELARTIDRNQLYLSLHSQGGMVQEGVAIGRYLREQGIGTILLPNAICASACT